MRSVYRFLLLLIPLACSPLRVYQQLPEVQEWEADIRAFERLDSTETYPDHAILFAGSSSIRLWSTLAGDMAPYPVIQRGYGGAKLSDLVVYASRIIYPHRFSAIVLFVANDITGNEDDKTPAEVARLFRHVLEIIREKYPDVPVFWIATTPCALRWDAWPEIAKANQLIEESCRQYDHTHFIRTDDAFLNAASQPREELFQPDRLHLNTRGYAVWAVIIRDALDNRLKVHQPASE